MIDVTKRKNIKKGLYVKVKTSDNKETKGYVYDILSKTDSKNGIRVIITSELTKCKIEGNVVAVPSKAEIQKEVFKFYNIFFSQKEYYSIIDCNQNFYVHTLYKGNIQKSMVVVFSNHLDAVKFLDKLKESELTIKRISKKNLLQNNFSNYKYEYYLLNGVKIVNKNKFDELEKFFLSH